MKKSSANIGLLLLAYLIVCAGALYSYAAEEGERNWTLYMKTRDRSVEYYFDKEAMVKTPENMLNVWRKRVFAKGAAQKEIISFDNLACDYREEYRTFQLTLINWDGTSKTYDKPGPWAHIYTNSPEQYLVDKYCKEQPSGKPEDLNRKP